MEKYNTEEIISLLLETIAKHKDVDLKIVANIYVNHKIIKDMVEKDGISEYDALIIGRNIQSDIESILVKYVIELSKNSEYEFDINTMILKRKKL